MKLVGEGRMKSFVLLAPPECHLRLARQVIVDGSVHQDLLAGAQRLRGRIYAEDGAIRSCDLTGDGRHVQPADSLSWHLLTVDERGRVTACMRYFAHDPGTAFSELTVSRSTIAHCAALGAAVRDGIEAELDLARRRGFSYVELGGWAISENLRHTGQAIKSLIAVYALSQLMGGARGLSTATTRHGSASILRRVGGAPLMSRGVEIPPYYDPGYRCDMELLRFDSTSPSPRYAGWIRECSAALRDIPVISGEHGGSCGEDLLHLHRAVGNSVRPSHVTVAERVAFRPI